jgi:glycerophosphoryl diester phosphodiesterase
MAKPLVIAHRGDSSEALENSLAAFRLALAIPVDMIELDLRLSRDGSLYVMHDKHTGRTAERNVAVEAASSKELDGIRLRNGERIPRLDDVLELVTGKAGINIEIKSHEGGAALARHLAGLPSAGILVVSSFREAELLPVRSALPDLRCAVIYDTFSLRHVAAYRAKGYSLISLRKNTVTEPLVRACHGQGVGIFVWTVDAEEEMKRCIDWEVDGIYTNKPLLLKQVLDRRYTKKK